MITLRGRTKDAFQVSRERLLEIPVPERLPERLKGCNSRFWLPVQHGQLAAAVSDCARSRSYPVRDERWYLCRRKQGLIGVMYMGKPPEGASAPSGVELCFGIRHSNDGYWAMTVVVGANVIVCGNGLITGEYVVSRKHTTHADIPDLVTRGFDLWREKLPGVNRLVERFRSIPVEDSDERRIVVEAGRRGIFPWKDIGKIDEFWRRPEQNEFEPRTAWSLLNAFTATVRDSSASLQMKRLVASRELLEEMLKN